MTSPGVLASRIFDMADQQGFAALSGDYNPMHVDPIAARRTQAGRPAVHGIHVLLWALETWLAAGAEEAIIALSVSFDRFVGVGDRVELHSRAVNGATKLEVLAGTSKLMKVTVRHQPKPGGNPPQSVEASEPVAIPATPNALDFAQAASANGTMAVAPGCATHWPLLARRLGAARIDALVGTSTLVGMVVPGLHSIFSSLNLSFEERAGPAGALAYRVADAREVFRLLQIEVVATGLAGTLQAFLRQPPVCQPSLAAVSGKITPGEFSTVDALIVGGSRGLGELTAKLLAAGGAKTTLTYAFGRAEAEAVAAELRNGGAECSTLPFDARGSAIEQLAALPASVNQVYYFATGPIDFTPADYSPTKLATYIDLYANGFARVCEVVFERAADGATLFYPSSVFVEERAGGMAEYVMAKVAGEVLCDAVPSRWPGLNVVLRRLPRLLTDQTATVSHVETPDGTDTMIEIARAMRDAGNGARRERAGAVKRGAATARPRDGE